MKNKYLKTALITGGFDPIHLGHIEYIRSAKALCGHLVVGLNSDNWLSEKKGTYFMNLEERMSVMKNIKGVDKVIAFDDLDGSGCDAIIQCLEQYDEVIFANGGDRNKNNSIELNKFKNDKRIKFVFGIGGEKKLNSSSWILDRYKNAIDNINLTTKPWGHFSTLLEMNNYKIKEILVKPEQKLSLQYHKIRSEYWIFLKGQGEVTLDNKNFNVNEGDYIYIPVFSTHRVYNYGKNDLVFIEVSLGDYIEEDDIVRLEDIYNRI